MSIDIIELIESNPITRFSEEYHSRLVEKIKNTFTNYEQQLFLSSFYCYLNYDSKSDFVINLDDVWKWLGFSQKARAKELIEKNFVVNKDYKHLLSFEGKQTNTSINSKEKKQRGGHNKENIMLNIETFKKMCLKANTKKADEVHDYFINLENILFKTTEEECNELKNQLIQAEYSKNKEIEEKIVQHKDIERETLLLNKYANSRNIVYLIKVKSNTDGTYVVKIGESRKGIKDRYNECRTKHKNILLLNCFNVDRCKDFESFLHNHKLIHPNKCQNMEGHETENELFLIGGELTYNMLIDIIETNIDKYNYKTNELLLENEMLKMKLESTQPASNNDEISDLRQMIKILLNKVNCLEQTNKEILNKLNSQQTKLTTGFNQQLPNLGPRLQKINPENLQLIKVYESVTELMNEDIKIKRPSIMKAIKDNTIYCGFRWLLVERNLDENIIHSISPTKEIKIKNIGYIAKLDEHKSCILNVYLDRKTAAQLNGYESSSGLDSPVKNGTMSRGHYYVLYENCDEELIYEFEEKNGGVLLFKNGVGQFDENNILTNIFSCKYDCIKQLKISDKTLSKCINKNLLYNGYFYRLIGEKLYM